MTNALAYFVGVSVTKIKKRFSKHRRQPGHICCKSSVQDYSAETDDAATSADDVTDAGTDRSDVPDYPDSEEAFDFSRISTPKVVATKPTTPPIQPRFQSYKTFLFL